MVRLRKKSDSKHDSIWTKNKHQCIIHLVNVIKIYDKLVNQVKSVNINYHYQKILRNQKLRVIHRLSGVK